MPTVTVQFDHSLDIETAVERMKKLLMEFLDEHSAEVSNYKESWEGEAGSFSFSILGLTLSGDMAVETGCAVVRVALPMIALPYKGRMEAELRRRGESLFA